jgi:predicted membrane protein
MALEYLNMIATELGVSVWLLCALLVWTLTWKFLALWKSARKGSIVWFILLAVFITVGVLPILYIFVFSKLKMNSKPVAKKKSVKKKVKKKSKK